MAATIRPPPAADAGSLILPYGPCENRREHRLKREYQSHLDGVYQPLCETLEEKCRKRRKNRQVQNNPRRKDAVYPSGTLNINAAANETSPTMRNCCIDRVRMFTPLRTIYRSAGHGVRRLPRKKGNDIARVGSLTPPVKSQRPKSATITAITCDALGFLFHNNQLKIGTNRTNRPVMKPELPAVVYLRPIV